MWQLFTLLVLFALMGGLSVMPIPAASTMVAAMGFVLLAAFTLGEFFKRVGLPALLGYIVAGIVFGPDLAEIIFGGDQMSLLPADFTGGDKLKYVEILTVGVIGTLGGGELKVADLKDQIATILTVVGFSFAAIFTLSAGTVYALAEFFPSVVPFLSGADSTVVISVSLLFGVFGFAMSPAATLAIIQETKSEGPFTSLVLGIVIVAELVVVAAFLLTFAFSEILIEQGSLAWDPLLAELPVIGAEFMWALIIGAVTGVLFILYFRFVAREMIFFTVGVIFVAYYACDVLHAEKLLAFITAGFIVQNLSKHGHDMIEALERISLPVFVVYFTIRAADLDLGAVNEFIVVTVILTAIRTGAIWLAVRQITTRLRPKMPPDHKKYLWLSFFSRGSVDLVLVGIVASNTGPGFGWTTEFEAVIMAMIVVHIVAGPPILKLAFEGVGETRDDEEPTEEPTPEEPETDEAIDLDAVLDEPFPAPQTDDAQLNAHLEQMRTEMEGLYRERVLEPIEQHTRHAQQITERIEGELSAAFDGLAELLEEPEAELAPRELARRVRRQHMRFRQSIQPQIELLEQLEVTPLRPETAEGLLADIRSLEGFETHFHVPWGDEMLQAQPDDGMVVRTVKAARRAYHGISGSGSRTVPVGRLWRYYVELTLPGHLARAASKSCERSEEFWFELGEQLRRIDQLFERVVWELTRTRDAKHPDGDLAEDSDLGERNGDEILDVPMSTNPVASPFLEEDVEAPLEGEAELEDDDGGSRLERARRALEAATDFFESRRDYLTSERQAIRQTVLERFTLAMRRPYLDFLEGTTRAGTIQLPAFRYRPSTRFDSARRAESRLLERLGDHADLVAGYRGWMILDQQLVLFLHWFHGYRDRITGVLDRYIRQQSLQALRNLESRCVERPRQLTGSDNGDAEPTDEEQTPAPEVDVDWPAWLDEQVKPSIHRARTALNRALVKLSQGSATQHLLDVIETRVGRFTERMQLLEKLPRETVASPGTTPTDDVPVRQWFMAELIREAALRFVEFNEHAERSLRRSLVALEDVEQILEFNLRTAQHRLDEDAEPGEMNEVAEGGLDRAATRIGDLSESLLRDENELRHWILKEMCRIVCSAGQPFFRNDVSTINQELEAHSTDLGGRSERSISGVFGPIVESWSRITGRLGPVFSQLAGEIRESLSEEEVVPDHDEIRERLHPEQNAGVGAIPVIYRRLFTPIPVDIPDFYIPRPDLERACMEAVVGWFHGRSTSLLIHGDRGMGKRTLVHHLLPAQLFDTYNELDEEQLLTVSLGERITNEAELCRELSAVVEGDEVDTLDGLTGRLRNQNVRRVVFVENTAHLFARTSEGLDLMRRFLKFVGDTADQVLWVVMLGKPTATFLETTLDLGDYFTHSWEVPRFDADQIEEMITTRHRVSGFHLDFQPPESRLIDRLRHPIAATETTRHPRRAYFERLGRLSGGNPMMALLYWLESVRPDPDDDTRFIVEPLPPRELRLVPPLSLVQKMVLATIIQHSSISCGLLARVLNESGEDVKVELNHLQRLGFVELLPGRREIYRMRAIAEPLVTRELRDLNML